MRTVASQMKDAVGQLGDDPARRRRRPTGEDVVFSASGRVITFHGFLKAYVEGTDDDERRADDQETRLPDLSRGRRRSRAASLQRRRATRPSRRPATPRPR